MRELWSNLSSRRAVLVTALTFACVLTVLAAEFSKPGKSSGSTAIVRLEDATRERVQTVLRHHPSETIRLHLKVGLPPETVIDSLAVLINAPETKFDLSETNLHLAAIVTVQPTADTTVQQFYVNLRRPLHDLQRRGALDLSKPISVTVVPIHNHAVATQSLKDKVVISAASITVPGTPRD